MEIETETVCVQNGRKPLSLFTNQIIASSQAKLLVPISIDPIHWRHRVFFKTILSIIHSPLNTLTMHNESESPTHAIMLSFSIGAEQS